MDSSISKVTTIEAVCLVVIITVNRIILSLPQIILDSCGSSAVLNIIYITLIAIIFTFIIVKLFKNFSNSDIVDISNFVGGKILRGVIGFILIVYLIVISGILIRNFSEVLHIIYYSRTNIVYLLLFFVITAAISNFLGEPAIVKSNVVISIIIILSLIVTFVSVLPNIVWQRIFPILGYGFNETFFSGLSNIFSFNGLLCLYFLMPMLSEKKDFKKISIISVVIIGFLIMLSSGCLLLSLAFTSSVEAISPVYTLISNNEFGDFLQHPESLFVFTWILSIMTYLNVVVLFVVRFAKKLTGINNPRLLIIPICILIFIICLLPGNIIETHKVETAIYKFVAFPLTFIILPAILIIGNLKIKKKA